MIDYVNGMADIEARLVRTIGDPDIRFREDPVRILRAVKFAARCNLNIEPETYRRMLDHAELTSNSIYLPTRTFAAFLKPRESSACSIALPCGSRMPCFNVT